MTTRRQVAANRRPFEPWETGQILDHYVAGFEWTIPSRLDVVDFAYPELFPPHFHGQPMLVFSGAPPLARVSAGPGLLEDFLKLESAPEGAILAYARRWGPLWLCPDHLLPEPHDPECGPCVCNWELDEDEVQSRDQIADGGIADEPGENAYEKAYIELLLGWRLLSRQARATIRIARRLHDGRAGDQADWDSVPLTQALMRLLMPLSTEPFMEFGDIPYSAEMKELLAARAQSRAIVGDSQDLHLARDPAQRVIAEGYLRHLDELGERRMAESLDFQRQVFGEVLNFWLEMAAVRPRMDWSGSKPAVQLGGHGLIGALAVQLLFDCSRTDGLAVCTSCGTPFLPGPRRPRRDRNVYCSDCGLKAATRDASARYRQTKKYRETYQKWFEEKRSRPAE